MNEVPSKAFLALVFRMLPEKYQSRLTKNLRTQIFTIESTGYRTRRSEREAPESLMFKRLVYMLP